MARSDYIYPVLNRTTGLPVAAFTVKREMVRWLRTQEIPEQLRVWRMGDGGWAGRRVTELDVDELIHDQRIG